jgi:diaminohydroxyphosphoribosylaminopyrimidine deaminase/5-amino-6-(5-phosphoribosylamino)uracil reductase
MAFSEDHIQFMKRALALARRGLGRTTPNPCVGAVVVRDGVVVGEGYHHRAGSPHAEVLALRQAGHKAEGATLYVSLEPCHTTGRTPPCTDAIIASGISRVFAATRDPFQKSELSSLKILRRHGISLHFGILKKEACLLNQVFFKNVLQKMPYVTGHAAMTLDGKISSITGDSRGLSSLKSLKKLHELRSQHDAVLVGVNTVLRDNPHLGVRMGVLRGPVSRDPLRIILDSDLRSPLSAQVFRDDRVLVIADDTVSLQKRSRFEKKGIRVLTYKKPFLKPLLKKLFGEGVRSIYVEGGSHVLTSFWEQRLFDRFTTFIVPKFSGGEKALTPLGGRGIPLVKNFDVLEEVFIDQFDHDVFVDGYFRIFESPK